MLTLCLIISVHTVLGIESKNLGYVWAPPSGSRWHSTKPGETKAWMKLQCCDMNVNHYRWPFTGFSQSNVFTALCGGLLVCVVSLHWCSQLKAVEQRPWISLVNRCNILVFYEWVWFYRRNMWLFMRKYSLCYTKNAWQSTLKHSKASFLSFILHNNNLGAYQ